METLIAITVLVILGLLAFACVPNRLANSRPMAMRLLVTGLVAVEFLMALVLILSHQFTGGSELSLRLVDLMPDAGVHLSILYDGVAGLMLLLVSFVGLIVCRFSIRYLDGEAAQGRYFRWLGFTIGAVSLMVVVGNLLLFFIAWVMTSLALHQLLLHYRHRPAAHRAAWTKFGISRLGDVFLVIALGLTFKTFGTFDLTELFSQAEALAGGSSLVAGQAAIAWLLMLGAVTKSAQFPFHVWLPDTMETPTPVSALMHAGIVNAGGYLVIRMSPLIALAPEALITLAVIGAFTACFAGIVMMTQPSIKRSLAYSTIAQMGFMMLQCGLGAFSAAMLHIIAHSLYKAHAFLTSGSVLTQSGVTAGAGMRGSGSVSPGAAFVVAAAATVIAYIGTVSAFDLNIAEKPGGFVLAFILCLALTTWGWQLLRLGKLKTGLIAVVGLTGLSGFYFLGYLLADHLVGPAVPAIPLLPGSQGALVVIAAAFAGLFALQVLLTYRVRPEWLPAFRVHAANGFYVDGIYHRLFASLPRS